MPRTITFDPDALDEIDALYIVDLLNDIIQRDEITEGLAKAAYEIADNMYPRAQYERLFAIADAIYPQTECIWTPEDKYQLASKRAEHLRRFGFLKDVAE